MNIKYDVINCFSQCCVRWCHMTLPTYMSTISFVDTHLHTHTQTHTHPNKQTNTYKSRPHKCPSHLQILDLLMFLPYLFRFQSIKHAHPRHTFTHSHGTNKNTTFIFILIFSTGNWMKKIARNYQKKVLSDLLLIFLMEKKIHNLDQMFCIENISIYSAR